ncbi:hypothetical protein SCUCBS95973_000976 [Sporothrix curviconia]|uniref:Uncharacterized protein n=1 Tax=Sporothrix curviconia TaxID=1260050 RepID=A0ABP0AUP7_9PEZI
MEHVTQENPQNPPNSQNPQNPQQQQQAPSLQNTPSQQEGRQQSSRKRITKTSPDSIHGGSNKRPTGNSSAGEGPASSDQQPPIPERSSSFQSSAALTASELLKMGGVGLQAGEDGGGLDKDQSSAVQQQQQAAFYSGENGEDSDATEFGEGSEMLSDQQQQQQQQQQQAAAEAAQASFAARKGKGKDKKKTDKKKNKDKGTATGGGGQDGKPSAAEGAKQESNKKQKERERDESGGNVGGGGAGGAGGGGGGEQDLANYAFAPQHFIENMDSDDNGHGDYQDHSGYGGHGSHYGIYGDGDESNIINLNNFPTNTGPNGARLYANLNNSNNNNNNASSMASSAFASITHTLANLVPLPRAPREDYMRTISNDHHGMQQTLQSLMTMLQHEQARRMAAEENCAVLEENVEVYKNLAAQFREEATKMREETERSKKGHMQVLRDLNRFKAGQGFAQMADDFLTQKARELRQDIRDFAIQYFAGDFDDPAKNEHPPTRTETKLGEFMFGITPLDPFESFLVSPTRCSSAIESFLWVILVKTVFGGWYWAGAGRLPLHDVFAWMRPVDYAFAVYNDRSAGATGDAKDANAADPEAERRFYTWRATTAKLVSERPGIMVRDNLRNKLVEEICATIEPYVRSNDGSHTGELLSIVNKAIEFDRDTSQQASRLEWVFSRTPGQKEVGEPVRFNSAVMDIQKWEDDPTEQSEVLLVVAPGLRKRGRSNGEDYAVETMLLKMDVTCDPVTDMILT